MRRATAVLPVALVLVTALTGCGSATDAPTVDDVADRIDAAMAGVMSYDFTTTYEGVAPGEATGSVLHADGTTSFREIQTFADGATMQLRYVDDRLYVQAPELAGDFFVEVDPDDPASELAEHFGGIGDGLGGGELEGMHDAITRVTPIGDAVDLDGVRVHVYEVVIDSAAVDDAVAGVILESLGVPELPATMTHTYWLDADDVVHRARYEVGASTTTTRLRHHGAGTPVVAPPAEIVVRESEL